jgi:AcrR family transcriptional regulator
MAESDGLRQRKQRQTRERIVEVGLALFREKGIEDTTLDEIAAAADISRRTFFSYFPAKEDVVLAWQDGAEAALKEAVTATAIGRDPLEAVQAAMKMLAPLFVTHNFLELDRLMQSTETLKAKKERHFEHQTECLFATLSTLWPDTPRSELKIVAMVSIGCLKIGVGTWMEEGGARPVTECLDEAFTALRHAI